MERWLGVCAAPRAAVRKLLLITMLGALGGIGEQRANLEITLARVICDGRLCVAACGFGWRTGVSGAARMVNTQ